MTESNSVRRRHGLIVPALAVIFVFAACAKEATAPRFVGASHDIQGSWTTPFTFPGNSFTMTLAESGGTVSGIGNFAGEAGPFGALSVSGNATPDSVHLQIVFKYDSIFTGLHPDTAQFSGVLVTLDSMNGTFTRGSFVSTAQYVRLKIGDPPAR